MQRLTASSARRPGRVGNRGGGRPFRCPHPRLPARLSPALLSVSWARAHAHDRNFRPHVRAAKRRGGRVPSSTAPVLLVLSLFALARSSSIPPLQHTMSGSFHGEYADEKAVIEQVEQVRPPSPGPHPPADSSASTSRRPHALWTSADASYTHRLLLHAPRSTQPPRNACSASSTSSFSRRPVRLPRPLPLAPGRPLTPMLPTGNGPVPPQLHR